MSREALVNLVAESVGVSKKDASAAVSAVTQGIESLLVAGQDVSIIGFGKFSVKDVPERTGRNPSTGEQMVISAKRQVKFTPGKALKDAVQK
jgi:DNA-binding protein HU-beta